MTLYWKSLLFRRGCTVRVSLLYECNLSCPYCTLDIVTGVRARSRRVGLEDWKHFIDNFPVKVKEVYLTGGEPTTVKYFPELVNWLLREKGLHVSVFTNLFSLAPFKTIMPHHRFKVSATYHHSDDPKRFLSCYQSLESDGFCINVDELESPKVFEFSHLKPLLDADGLKAQTARERQFLVAPDQTIYIGCYECYLSKGVK